MALAFADSVRAGQSERLLPAGRDVPSVAAGDPCALIRAVRCVPTVPFSAMLAAKRCLPLSRYGLVVAG